MFSVFLFKLQVFKITFTFFRKLTDSLICISKTTILKEIAPSFSKKMSG